VSLHYAFQTKTKLENILLDRDGHIVITDFGLSKELNGPDSLTYSFCGTFEYMAPEVVSARNPESNPGHNMPVDWWSLGVLTTELLTGQSPFSKDGEDNGETEVLERILGRPPDIQSHIKGDVRDFITRLLIKDPSRRLGSVLGAIELNNHPFFKGINWVHLASKRMKPGY
jgi:ribosomal protein S6 kinase alpha-5